MAKSEDTLKSGKGVAQPETTTLSAAAVAQPEETTPSAATIAQLEETTPSESTITLSQALGKLLSNVTRGHFNPMEKELPRFSRFAYAAAGAFTVLFPMLVVMMAGFFSVLVLEPPQIISFISIPVLFSPIVVLFVIIFLPIVFFGYIISFRAIKHGPVSLYIAGLLLTAFTMYIVIFVWSGYVK